jgi:hypothetical protein
MLHDLASCKKMIGPAHNPNLRVHRLLSRTNPPYLSLI